MMMNGRVDIGSDRGGDQRAASGVDEKLVVLHRRLKRIANARAHLDLQEAEALREAQRLQLWRQFGHTSLADYMVNELGYSSHRVAEDRLRVANALPALPALTAAIQNGNINFSQAKELVRVATPDTEKVWIEKAQDMNVREVEQAVAGHCKGDLPDDPIDPRLVRKMLYLSVRPETEVLFREVRQALDRERGEKLDEDAVLEALCRAYLADRSTRAPAANAPSASTEAGETSEIRTMNSSIKNESVSDPRGSEGASRSDGAAPYRVAVTSEIRTISSSIKNESVSDPRGSEGASRSDGAAPYRVAVTSEIRTMSSSIKNESVSDPRGSEGTSKSDGAAPYRVAVTVCKECKRGWQHGGGLVTEMTPAAVERAQCDAQWIGDLDSDVVERARQEISAAMRRKVLHRDQKRCQVPGCLSHRNLDVHHIQQLTHGGKNELSNLITLCEAHHLALHDGTLIIERANGELRFRHEGRNNFTRATREVETRQALRVRGFDRATVREIMRRTVSHVGVSDLSADQWIAIALRYAEKTAT
jgi:hypothetical protein